MSLSNRAAPALLMAALAGLCPGILCAAELAQTIERIKPSVVGVGSYLKVRSPAALFVGTESGDFSAIVREGEIAPSTGDATFASFDPPALSSTNSVLTFRSTLEKGSGDPAAGSGRVPTAARLGRDIEEV